jgi:hypothetical protein
MEVTNLHDEDHEVDNWAPHHAISQVREKYWRDPLNPEDIHLKEEFHLELKPLEIDAQMIAKEDEATLEDDKQSRYRTGVGMLDSAGKTDKKDVF